ncbi:hypothetical protein BDY24DRAFT_433732 [Mrakia frigida]|uniref:uncharacterized protein n=1 Tax=Mrakia frigida TaxID=29902 RepID=UPI003FCC0E0D
MSSSGSTATLRNFDRQSSFHRLPSFPKLLFCRRKEELIRTTRWKSYSVDRRYHLCCRRRRSFVHRDVKRQTVTTELGLLVAGLVAEILQDVVNIVAGLGTLPLLGPLLLAIDQLLVRLLNALAPTVGGLLLAVASLLFNLGGTNLALLVASLGLGLTAALLGLSI